MQHCEIQKKKKITTFDEKKSQKSNMFNDFCTMRTN